MLSNYKIEIKIQVWKGFNERLWLEKKWVKAGLTKETKKAGFSGLIRDANLVLERCGNGLPVSIFKPGDFT